eukprot:gnl/MRDRNA2_/MRDRNA2_14343_c0_seq2.p1 gnl/MRDRNA2_/MRDRNA2_14343_c0~~gnl/MRDRNA2_/MRDRNA2_14343_c0_seq2.p1  ORF type:complete len:378 (+),score=74.36 gnl/MRDRNA2_/MRDRNA2_14343_c0_seq2:293-1426(+)
MNKILSVMGADEPFVGKRMLLHRKFNVIFHHPRVRTRLYVYRTRSVEEVENDMDDAERSSFESMLNTGMTIRNKLFRFLQKPVESMSSKETLIRKHKLNVQQVRNDKGAVVGEKFITCDWWQYNETSKEYDIPPLEKCYRLDIVDLQIIPTVKDYLDIEEIPIDQNGEVLGSQGKSAPGMLSRWATAAKDYGSAAKGKIMKMAGYENVGFVLALVEKVARMLFVRDSFKIKAADHRGKYWYCSDQWRDSESEGKARPEGVFCDQDPAIRIEGEDEEGDAGAHAGFEFEFVELKPVWNGHKNEQEFGIRGGYNLHFCRILTGGQTPGALMCDVQPPVHENTQVLKAGALPPEARFRLEDMKGRPMFKPKVQIPQEATS